MKTLKSLTSPILLSLLLLVSFVASPQVASAGALKCSSVYASENSLFLQHSMAKSYVEAADVVIPWIMGRYKERLIKFQEVYRREMTNETSDVNDHIRREAKDLRKFILEVRLYLELFAPAYGRVHDNSAWMKLWKDLKKGYSLLGNYKGVKKANIEARGKKLSKLVQWLDQQLAGTLDLQMIELNRARVDNPIKGNMPDKIHWDASLLKVSRSMSAAKVFNDLAVALLQKAAVETQKMLATKDFNNPHDAESFHDFRKQMRTAIKLLNITDAHANSTAYQQLSRLIWEIGQLNDKIEDLQKNLKNPDLKEQTVQDLIQKKQQKVDKMWAELKRDNSPNDINLWIESLILDVNRF